MSAEQMPSCGVHQRSQSANRGLREWHTAVKGRRWGVRSQNRRQCRPNVLMETNSCYVNAKCAIQQPTYVCTVYTSLVPSPYFHSDFRSEGEIGPGDIGGSKPSTSTAGNGQCSTNQIGTEYEATYLPACSNI